MLETKQSHAIYDALEHEILNEVVELGSVRPSMPEEKPPEVFEFRNCVV